MAVLLLGLGVYLIPNHPAIMPVYAASRSISLAANLPYWNSSDPTIIVTKGDSITMTLSAPDGYSHRFLLDFDGDGVSDVLDCSTTGSPDICTTVPPTTTLPVFTANTLGNFSYYCTVHYPSMQGIFRVQNPPPPPSPDFGISSNPTTLTLSPGSSGTTTVTLTSLNGFSGKPSLSATVVPSGPQIAIVPTSLTVSPGSSATAAMTVTTSGTGAYSTPTPAGNYVITIVGSNSSLSHSTTVSLTVGSSSGSSALPLTWIFGAAVGTVAVIAAAIFLIRRKPRGTV